MSTAPPHEGRHAWVDATAGIAGDMLLAALVDAGAPLDDVQRLVDAVLPDTVRLVAREVTRAGLRARKVDVEVLVPDQPHRHWSDIRELLRGADLPEPVRAGALAVFGRLAEAEAVVHGVAADDVHFHEVGAWDSVADVVGVCAALHLLGVGSVSASPVALGSGTVRAAHGRIPVPAPATLELAAGWSVTSGGDGELATPTGLALVRGLATRCEALPPLLVEASGVGAGTRDVEGRPNVVRVVVGSPTAAAATVPTTAAAVPGAEGLWVLEANVDDLDPRLWPGVLDALLDAGAADAWLTPIHMKKGRPAHTLSVLTDDARRAALRAVVLAHTTTFGVREHEVERHALGRTWVPVAVTGGSVRVKLSLDEAGCILHATPEFEDVSAVARERAVPERVVMAEAHLAATDAGLRVGSPAPGRD